jgi:hypothetical protein
MNDTMQEIGTALGVAVLGGVAASAYRSALPASVPDGASSSYGEALRIAHEQGPAGVGLAAAARAAFDLAVEHSLVVGSLTALLGAVVGLVILRRHVAPIDDLEGAVPTESALG